MKEVLNKLVITVILLAVLAYLCYWTLKDMSAGLLFITLLDVVVSYVVIGVLWSKK